MPWRSALPRRSALPWPAGIAIILAVGITTSIVFIITAGVIVIVALTLAIVAVIMLGIAVTIDLILVIAIALALRVGVTLAVITGILIALANALDIVRYEGSRYILINIIILLFCINLLLGCFNFGNAGDRRFRRSDSGFNESHLACRYKYFLSQRHHAHQSLGRFFPSFAFFIDIEQEFGTAHQSDGCRCFYFTNENPCLPF